MAVHLCLDLGTAFSKASAWGTGSDGRPRPLRIAEAVHQGDYTVPTAVCIHYGALYFGHEALEHGRASANSSAFIELKQYMTHKRVRPLDTVILPSKYNPTQAKVSIRQAISLYMAFLGKAAADCLPGEPIEGKTLTMPVLTGKRGDNMKNELRLAGYYGWELSREDDLWHGSSLNLNEALRLLRRLEKRNPRCIDMPTTLEEPLGVMASRMATYTPAKRDRRIYMVVDVGAGTTDFGLFVSVNVDGEVGVYPLAGSTFSLPIGGNNIDKALIECVLKKSSLARDRRRIARASLVEQARLLKEELLEKKDNEPMLFPDAGVELTKQEFIDSDPVQVIRSKIKAAFDARLNEVDVSWLELASKLPPERGLSVFFAGGGGRLEFLRDIVPRRQPQSYNHSSQFFFSVAEPDPSWATERGMQRTWQQIRRIFPQTAVSLGGAVVGAEVNEHLNVEHQLERWDGHVVSS